jgi:FixJ family two-component response regulator
MDVRASSLIAVIDDDGGMRVSLDGLLRSLGHRTVLFESAERFLASGAAHDADCVISDVHMPGGMSGVELARLLADRHPDMPVILMSGFTEGDCREQAEKSQVQCLLSKPFDDGRLIACLEEALEA